MVFLWYNLEMNILQKYIPKGLRRGGELITPKVLFIVAHDTGNDGATGANHVSYYNNTYNDQQVSAHAFVDDVAVYEVIPLNEKAWHVRYNVDTDNKIYGYDANDTAIGVELCYSTKGNIDNLKAYTNYCEYMAYLCLKYGLDPQKQIVAHAKLDPSRRTDPMNAFQFLTGGKTWDSFIVDVMKVYNAQKPKPPTIENPTGTPSDLICASTGKRAILDTILELIKQLFK